MEQVVLAVFGLVYAGMILGGLPGLALDRAGVAVLGAIVLLAAGVMTPDQAWRAVDVPTVGLLFGLMVVSAQLRLGGFYTALTRRIVSAGTAPHLLLGLVVLAAGVLSALLANDIVCLAMTPVLVQGCLRRGLNPMPFLLALACASNVGSAATLIGNPQNMLIGQVSGMGFGAYLLDAGPPSIFGLGAVWGIVGLVYRNRMASTLPPPELEMQDFNAWQTVKGLGVLGLVVAAFLSGPWPRDVLALAGAGLLMLSRRQASHRLFRLVDWNLILLFFGLFVVNAGLASSGLLDRGYAALSESGIDLSRAPVLFVATAALSNVISNVPAVMLLLPVSQGHPAGLVLALSSTLAGNLLLVGSIANLIVAEGAGRLGVRLTWREHLGTGIPVTLATMLLAGGWLWLRWGSLAVR